MSIPTCVGSIKLFDGRGGGGRGGWGLAHPAQRARPCGGMSSHFGARSSPYMSIRCQSRQANVVNGSGYTIGAHSPKSVPSGRSRSDQQPGAGSQRYSSSVRPSSRCHVRSHTVSDNRCSSSLVATIISTVRSRWAPRSGQLGLPQPCEACHRRPSPSSR